MITVSTYGLKRLLKDFKEKNTDNKKDFEIKYTFANGESLRVIA